MKNKVGIWIDHREAFIVSVGETTKDIQHIESGVEKHGRFSGRSASEEGSENQRDRQYTEHLNKYYDNVITHLTSTKSIYLFGPGEAKGEFKKRIAKKGLANRVVGVDSADKMTENEMVAKVSRFYVVEKRDEFTSSTTD